MFDQVRFVPSVKIHEDFHCILQCFGAADEF